MFNNLSNFLTPQTIVNFLKNNTDLNKIGMNFLNSEEGKQFIVETLGYDYDSFKETLFTAFASIKKSDYGIKKQHEAEEGQKIKIYRELANTLIKDDGLPIYGAVIMSAGFTGIDKSLSLQQYTRQRYSVILTLLKKHVDED